MNSFGEVSVAVSRRQTYRVIIGDDAALQIAEVVDTAAAVISNPTVWSLYGEKIAAVLQKKFAAKILIGDGEQHKRLKTVDALLTALIKIGLRRDGVIVALGGGVVGDVAGFAAAVYLRGLPLVQIPTTLLAQVDAAIGGKTGVNHDLGKNLIGAFHQPRAVLCDTKMLSTLPPRVYRAGLSEAIKYGLLGDADFFAWMENNADDILQRRPSTIAHLVETSVRAKAAIIMADELETGAARALLNLGHTFAHALEKVGGYGVWQHGEAVAAGLLAAAKLSEKVRSFPAADTARLKNLLRRLKLPTAFPDVAAADLQTAMKVDKKASTDSMNFIVMNKLGEAEKTAVDEKIIAAVLREMQAR